MVKKLKPTIQEAGQLKHIEKTCMSNEDINKYLPNCKIVSYNELPKYTSIFQLLPHNKSYVIILYQQSENSGHWVALLRYNNTIEYFDSLGNAPDVPLKWNSPEQNLSLGINDKYLSNLLAKSKMRIIYNPIKYQEQNNEISTCGAHAVLRIQTMLKGYDLAQYYEIMKKAKKEMGVNFDEIAAGLINKRS
ncbi:MAG: Ulp1 family isopeptidase [Candidatus Woesearchaeota archaeon]|nr:Ulp1 family isopeptidase [Candidatus Woesearchaeota archaeon]